MEKKKIVEKYGTLIDVSDIVYGKSIDEVIVSFQKLKEHIAELFPQTVDTVIQPDRYGDSDEFMVYSIRLETDDEFAKRKASKEKAAKTREEKKRIAEIAKEEKEKEEYERLKAKFS